MTAFDFGFVERELNLEVPAVYRDFMAAVIEMGICFPDYEFPNTAQDLVALNRELADAFPDLWRDDFLALLPDGCGNYFTLVASHADSDELVIVAHDPYGIEPFGPAGDLLNGYLNFDNPDRKKRR